MSTQADARADLPMWEVPVTYGAVGATKSDDLVRYPPKGYRPLERRVRVGYGAARWEHAWSETMSWGIQRRSGMRVRVLEAPAAATDMSYTPVSFDDDGRPIEPATVTESGEQAFTADGAPLVRPGDTAVLHIPGWPFDIPARVVYTIDEPTRKGFAYGTLPGHPERGEESFVVELGDDGSVWLTIRAFSRPSHWLLRIGSPLLRLVQSHYTRRYERALTSPLTGDRAA